MTISVLASFMAKKEHHDELKSELKKLLQPTRKEPGCINYDLHQSCENQGEFFLYENWKTEELLNAHLNSKHLQDFIKKSPKFLAKPITITKAKQII